MLAMLALGACATMTGPTAMESSSTPMNRQAASYDSQAVDLLINSLFQSWLATSPKGLQK